MSARTGRSMGVQFFTATVSTTLVLLLLGMMFFFVLAAQNLSDYVKENVNFSILLSDDMKEPAILRMQQQLNDRPFVKQSVYISKEEALKEQTREMGTNPADFLGYNPFPASIEIKLYSQYANVDSIAGIEKLLKQNINVQEVLYQKSLIEAVNKNIRNISLVLVGLAVLLSFISFVLINNTIRLIIYSKRFLIHTMKLVGASPWFIRRPFLGTLLFMGVLSAFLAIALLMSLAYWLVYYEPKLISVLSTRILIYVSVGVLLCGVLLTVLCAYFSVNKYLRMNATHLYYI